VKPLGFCAAIFLCSAIFGVFPLGAQESAGLPDNDIDSLFDEPEDNPDNAGEESEVSSGVRIPEQEGGGVIISLQSRGFTFDVYYSFIAGYSPGWVESPWHWKANKDNPGNDAAGNPITGDPFTQIFAAKMQSSFSLDFRVSPALRVRQVFQLAYPDYKLKVTEFFADYNMNDAVYFRVGRHTVNWGVSRNFPFANLPVLLPEYDVRGNALNTIEDDYSYAVKIDIPIGIGGIQLLALTRGAFMLDSTNPQLKEFGYGLKYNLAFDRADIDLGTYYHRSMPNRSFLSVKSTLPSGTEIYSEGVIALSSKTPGVEQNLPQNWNKREMSFAIGFYDEFFSNKLSLNLEYFFNGERDSRWLRPETSFRKEGVSDLLYGHNGAVNIIFKPGGLGGLRFVTQCLYGFEDKTAQLVPGASFTPISNLNVYLGFPMALGSRDGIYYRQNADEKNRPFSMVLAVSIGGNYRFSHYD
jgi:hypothetical protein